MNLGYVVLIVTGLLGNVAFVVLYAVRSPEWRHSDLGRNLMAKAVVIGGLLALSLLALLTTVPPWAWYGGMIALDAIVWWRVAILWRLQRDGGP